MTSFGRRLCVILFVGFSLVQLVPLVPLVQFLLVEYCGQIILDYICSVPSDPWKSLASIIEHRNELKDLEIKLEQMLKTMNHPAQGHLIMEPIEILSEYNKYIAAFEEYTREHGKLKVEDINGFVKTHKLILNRVLESLAKYQKMCEEKKDKLVAIAQRVTGVGNFKSAFILMRNMDIVTEKIGMILDNEQEEIDDNKVNTKEIPENYTPSAKNMEEDDRCFSILQQLIRSRNEINALGKRELLRELNEDENVTRQFEGNKTDLRQEVNLESKNMTTELNDIFNNKTNLRLIGKTKSFIMAATARVDALFTRVIQKAEDVWNEEMGQFRKNFKEKIAVSRELTDKLSTNMKLIIAHVLDTEMSHEEF